MATEKPRIDLKARLGKKKAAAANPASSPMQPLGGPAASAPPLGSEPAPPPRVSVPSAAPTRGPFGGPSIPPPPGFGVKPTPAARSVAPVAKAAPVAAPAQSITVDMSDEVVRAQKRGRGKIAVLALVVGAIGLAVGFGVGGMANANEGAQAALEGAKQLVKEVDEANLKVAELGETVKSAQNRLKQGKYPAKEVEALGALEIPFDGNNLMNKGIGRYNSTAVTMLMRYANSVESLKDQAKKIRRIFGAAKAPFEKTAKEKDNPQVHWGVSVGNGPSGPWATMTPVTHFPVANKEKKGYRWPTQIEVPQGRKKTTKIARFEKGEPMNKTQIIPVDPRSEGAVCPENIQFKMMKVLVDLRKDIEGDETPGREVLGVRNLGEKVMDELRAIGGPG